MAKHVAFIFFLFIIINGEAFAKDILCYHGTWSYSRPGNGQFNIADVPTELCTHYVYSFVGLDPTTYTVKVLDEKFDIDGNGLVDAVGLKSANPSLKVILAIGGWNEGSINYSTMAADPDLRTDFINSVLDIIEKYGFDGFDLDWEYPARRDSTNPNDKENFSTLLKELSEAFQPLGLFLSAAVSAVPSTVDISYDVPALSQYLNVITVMTYDIHGAWDNFAGFNSPLYSAKRYNGTAFQDYSIDASIAGWIERGADPCKLSIGVPLYGRTHTLVNASDNTPGSPTTGAGGPAGPYTAEPGFWSYLEIIEQFQSEEFTQGWDEEQQVPYAYSGNVWLSYDDVRSIKLKAEYILSHGLAGASVWAVDYENRLGVSGETFPLLRTVSDTLAPAAK